MLEMHKKVETHNSLMARINWLILLCAIICISLAISGALIYPLSSYNIIYILLYEVSIFAGVMILLRLVNEKGLPDEVSEPSKSWP